MGRQSRYTPGEWVTRLYRVGNMASIDKTKEEIGWLKVTFALLVASGIPLVGWVAQNFFNAPAFLLVVSAILIVAITIAIIAINRKVYRKIDELKEM